MNLINKLFVVIIFSILIFMFACALPCCKNNSTIKDSRSCKDGTAINITCEPNQILLNPDWGIYSSFILGDDDRGEYLDAYIAGYVIRDPYFCTGPMYFVYSNRTTKVAVTCSSYRVWYSDQSLNGSAEAKQEAKNVRIYEIFGKLFNGISAVAFLATAAIYYFLPEVQDLQGSCYFHFTFIAGLGHAAIVYMFMFDMDGLLPDMCITNVYVEVYFLLCSFMWLGVVNYNTWRNTRNLHSTDENQLFETYKKCAYGGPFTLLVFAWIHVHIEHSSGLELVLECYQHLTMVYTFYIGIPILFIIFLNFLMFVDTQIKIWNFHTLELRDRKLASKIIKYRLFMNTKLFFVMGVPWAIFIINELMDGSIYEVPFILEAFLTLLLFGEGIPIFIILVLIRKRVLRGMANRWLTNTNLFPDKWKTANDSETEEEDDENQTDKHDTNVQVRYTAQEIDEDKFNHSTSIITL